MKIKVTHRHNDPAHISIFTGITCNLACTICGPSASSRWRSELGMGKFSYDEYTIDSSEIITEVEDYDFSNVEYVRFGGGEPLLNNTSLAIFKRLNRKVDILLHSNGTVLPTQEYLAEFFRFDRFVLVFSVDDVEEQFEFLRWPAKWNNVVDNILWMKENCPSNVRFAFNTVVSLLNEPTHTRVRDWANQHIPTNNAGIETVWFTNETNGLLNRISDANSQDSVQFLDQLDTRRGTNWRKTFPIYASNFVVTA